MAAGLAAEIAHTIELAELVVDQTERRVLHGEEVGAEEKIFSIFEEHTDIIIKDRRDISYGHKLTVTGGRSGLILDWFVENGNPADSTLAVRMIERQREIYGRVPRQAAFDGGYASKENLSAIKDLGVKDVSFSKKRGLEVLDMVKSEWVYRRLRNFRAGIESWLSFLKRSFGLERANWRGQEGFARYVGASIVAANLVTLARHLANRHTCRHQVPGLPKCPGLGPVSPPRPDCLIADNSPPQHVHPSETGADTSWLYTRRGHAPGQSTKFWDGHSLYRHCQVLRPSNFLLGYE